MRRRADSLSDQAVREQRTITIGAVSGSLLSTHTCHGRTDLELLVGGHRAVFMLKPETVVEVGDA